MAEPIIWLIDDVLLERHDHTGFPDIATAAREAGHEVFMRKYVPLSEKIDFSPVEELILMKETKPILAYGCVGFIKQFQRHSISKFACPGSYLKKDELKFSKAAAMWGDYMLNERFIMLPYAEVKRRVKWDIEKGLQPPFFGQFITTRHGWAEDEEEYKLFLRPDVVTKTFAGRVFDFKSPEDDINALDKYEHISPEEIVIVAPVMSEYIQAEFRHVVCGGKVIASSQYRRDGKLDIRSDVDEDCLWLAGEIASKENHFSWAPDYVYVVDTALTSDGARIIEFNSFSCSGLYACDTRAIVEAVSEQAWKEFKGDPDV